ncbi:MAG: hypothetical protein AAF802_02535 [Planctomycetota bacterium]
MRKLVVKPAGGLCNRLRVIDSARKLATQSERELIVIWELNHDLNCNYRSLFLDPDFTLLQQKRLRRWDFPSLVSKTTRNPLWDRAFKRRLQAIAPGDWSVRLLNEFSEDLETLRPVTPERYANVTTYDKSVYRAFQRYADQLHELDESIYWCTCWRMSDEQNYRAMFPVQPDIQCRVDSVTEKFHEPVIGTHIRGTDCRTSKDHSGTEGFFQVVEEHLASNPTGTVFLATDEPSIKDQMIRRFGSQIVYFEQENYARSNARNIENALVDLLCLAKTKNIYGSYFSTFSQVAADWFGGTETTVMRNSASIVRANEQ